MKNAIESMLNNSKSSGNVAFEFKEGILQSFLLICIKVITLFQRSWNH